MVVETKFYDILSIGPTATVDEISKSYKKIALKCHPDKTNHDPKLTELFKRVTRAYEVLKDESSRKVYDQFGEAGLEGKVAPSQQQLRPGNFQYRSATDVFSQVFSDFNSAFNSNVSQSFESFGFPNGFNMGMNFDMSFNGPTKTQGMKRTVRPAGSVQKKKLHKGQDIYHVCKVTLEDLAYGKTIKLQLPRRTKCNQCNGEGGFDKSVCKTCEGSGRTITVMSNQFTKYQSVGACEDCVGAGTTMSSVCNSCDDGYAIVNKLIQLKIPPGAKDGNQIVIKCAADEGRDIIPGDVVVKLKQVKHPYLINRYNDLYMEHDIDLRTALLGGRITIKDFLKKGNDLNVYINVHGNQQLNDDINDNIKEGEIIGTINPGTPKIVKGLGMPINNDHTNGVFYDPVPVHDILKYKRGDLFIKFNVILPSPADFTNGVQDLQSLSAILPASTSSNEGNRKGPGIHNAHLSNLPVYSNNNDSSIGSQDSDGSIN